MKTKLRILRFVKRILGLTNIITLKEFNLADTVNIIAETKYSKEALSDEGHIDKDMIHTLSKELINSNAVNKRVGLEGDDFVKDLITVKYKLTVII